MTVRAVLFDLDGTLVDSLEDLTDAVNAMRSEFDRLPLSSSEVRGMVGKGARNLVQRALGTDLPDLVEAGLKSFVEFNTIHIADKSRLYPGVREALDALAHAGIRMVIISNKQEALSRLIMDKLGISHFFDTICGGDTFSEMKPSALPVMKVIEGFGFEAKDTVMVGDSINDIQAGTRAGVTTIGCAWGYGGGDELREADHLALSCGEVVEILLNEKAH